MVGKGVYAGVLIMATIALAPAGAAGAPNCQPSLGNLPSSQCPNNPKQKLKEFGPTTKAGVKDEATKAKGKLKQAGSKTAKSLECVSGPTSDGKCPQG